MAKRYNGTFETFMSTAVRFRPGSWFMSASGSLGLARMSSIGTDGTLVLRDIGGVASIGYGEMRMATNSKEAHTDSVTNAQPLVSIIIPYFNHPAYLAETVESARRQTYPNVEIIVVDDGSTVPASSILEPSDDIALIRTENGGVSSARNFGFQNSSGEYLIFLDADDRLMPGAVEAHLEALNSNPHAGMTFGPARIIDAHGNETIPPKLCRPRKDYFLMLLESNPIACPGSTMIRRQTFIQAGFFDKKFRNGEDYHLYLRVARDGALVQHKTCVVDYRKHSGGKSNNAVRMTAAVMAILDEFDGDPSLSHSQQNTLARGRKRWRHANHPKDTLAYRLEGLYYRFRAMLTVSIRHYFWR